MRHEWTIRLALQLSNAQEPAHFGRVVVGIALEERRDRDQASSAPGGCFHQRHSRGGFRRCVHKAHPFWMKALLRKRRKQGRQLLGRVDEARPCAAPRKLPCSPDEVDKVADARVSLRRGDAPATRRKVRRIADDERRRTRARSRDFAHIGTQHLPAIGPSICIQIALSQGGSRLMHFHKHDAPGRAEAQERKPYSADARAQVVGSRCLVWSRLGGKSGQEERVDVRAISCASPRLDQDYASAEQRVAGRLREDTFRCRDAGAGCHGCS